MLSDKNVTEDTREKTTTDTEMDLAASARYPHVQREAITRLYLVVR